MLKFLKPYLTSNLLKRKTDIWILPIYILMNSIVYNRKMDIHQCLKKSLISNLTFPMRNGGQVEEADGMKMNLRVLGPALLITITQTIINNYKSHKNRYQLTNKVVGLINYKMCDINVSIQTQVN